MSTRVSLIVPGEFAVMGIWARVLVTLCLSPVLLRGGKGDIFQQSDEEVRERMQKDTKIR